MDKFNKDKQLYAFFANRNGAWFNGKVVEVGNNGWHKNGDAHVKKLGLEHRGGYMCFSSYEKKEAEAFAKGFDSCKKLWEDFFK